MKNASPQKAETGARLNTASISKFTGTDNPRELRAIHAGMTRAMPREHLDRAIGCSNSPDVILRLRAKGLEFPCVKVPDTDRDGRHIRRGVYHLTEQGRRAVNAWNRTKQKGFITGELLNLLWIVSSLASAAMWLIGAQQ